MSEPTPSVDEFLAAEKADPNAWWRLDSGHHLNLFEEAVEQRDAARADRVCWRETHNQVAAERDAADSVIRHWHAGEVIDGDLWISDKGAFGTHEIVDEATPAEADAIRRALDASPTEGNPE